MASIFSSVALTHEQVAQTLAGAFTLDADPMGLGWVVVAAPGRAVIVEDGTQDISSMPDSILRRATQNLGGKPPVWCLSAIFDAGAVRGGGIRTVTDPDTGERDLGGAITADPRQLLDRSPGTEEFTLPDCSDVASIGEYGLQRLNIIIAAYEAFLDKVRGTDDVSFHLVLELLAAETHQRADIQAALARRS